MPVMSANELDEETPHQMRTFPPPKGKGTEPGLLILESLEKALKSRVGKKLVVDSAENEKCKVDAVSVRRINGGRFEIFLAADGKGTECFDALAESTGGVDGVDPSKYKHELVEFAKKQAQRDKRIPEGSKFQSFSLIVSFGKSVSQKLHIDLLHPNHQFGLTVTDNSHGTRCWSVDVHIDTPAKVVGIWKKLLGEAGESVDWGVIEQAMEKDPGCKALVKPKGFADVLTPKNGMTKEPPGKPLDRGTLLSLPGGIVHAGAGSSTTRAVIFFSSSPPGDDATPCNSDVQFTAVQLAVRLVTLLWPHLSSSVESRLALLHVLKKYQEASPSRSGNREDLEDMGDRCVNSFVDEVRLLLQSKKRREKSELKELLDDISNSTAEDLAGACQDVMDLDPEVAQAQDGESRPEHLGSGGNSLAHKRKRQKTTVT